MKHAPLIPAFLLLLLLACNKGSHSPAPDSSAPPQLPLSTGIDQEFKINVGPPDATLAVWILEPKAGTPIRGTVLFLHGFTVTHTHLLNAAGALRNAGYRTVLLDLRGWGESSPGRITFGVQDARDLMQLTDELQAHHLCGPTLGVYGTSYGASCAILYAATDPRVTAVVAVTPFANIRQEVPRFGRGIFGEAASFFSDSQLNSLANAVSHVASLDLDSSKPLEAIKGTRAQILLIHGTADSFIPTADSLALHAAAPRHSQLRLIPDADHLELSFDWLGILQKPTREWFDQYLAADRPSQ